MKLAKEEFIQQLQQQLNWEEEHILEDTQVAQPNIILIDEGGPLIYIEFVQSFDPIKYLGFNDLAEIHNSYGVPFIALTNGKESSIMTYAFGWGDILEDETDIIAFINKIHDVYNHYDIFRRLDYSSLTREEIVQVHIDSALISPVSTAKNQKRFTELNNAIYYEPYQSTGRKLPIEIIADKQHQYLQTKNASGRGYEGIHRVFDVRLEDGIIVPFALSIFSTATTKNDKVYKNRTGSSQFNIAMLQHTNSTYNLQLNLDKFIHFTENEYELWHNGIRSRMKKDLVIQTVRDIAPFLITDKGVSLGYFPLEDSIQNEAFSTFIENVICYSYCRNVADKRYR